MNPLFLVLGILAGARGFGLAQTEAVTFSATGDVPYTPAGRARFAQDIDAFNRRSRTAFMVHLGDIKSGAAPCVDEVYKDVSGLMKTIKVPTFIVVGDNEWNDCFKPSAAWTKWEEYFGSFEQNWPSAVPGSSPVERPKDRPENFAFRLAGVLFVGINLPGGRVHDQAEWDTRLPEDAAFIAAQLRAHTGEVRAAVILAHAQQNATHENFVIPFRASAALFGKPVLFLHGDGHGWIQDHPWPELNILRVQIVDGNTEAPVEVTVTTDAGEPFVFKRNSLAAPLKRGFDSNQVSE